MMTLLIILSFYYASRWILYLLVILLVSIAFLFNKITGGYLFRYMKKVRSRETANFLLAIQWIFSMLPALILPNNFLTGYRFFHDLYDKNEWWIPASMIGILCICLLTMGILFNAFYNVINKNSHEQTNNDNENRHP